MAHTLLTHLKKFITQPDVGSLPLSDQTFLKDIIELSDTSCELLDKIQDTVANLWRGKKPPVEIADLLEKNNFPVIPEKIEHGVWKASYIRTPKGRIPI